MRTISPSLERHRNGGGSLKVGGVMRTILTIIAVMWGASSAMAETWNEYLDRQRSPAAVAMADFEQSVAEYKKCLANNPNNANACEGLRHIMDASAQAAGHYNGSR
jgi:hypothetical protein